MIAVRHLAQVSERKLNALVCWFSPSNFKLLSESVIALSFVVQLSNRGLNLQFLSYFSCLTVILWCESMMVVSAIVQVSDHGLNEQLVCLL